MDSTARIQELQQDLELKLGSLEKLMRGYRLKLYWYLAILTVSTLGTVSYQVTAAWQIHKIGNMFQDKIELVDSRVDEILSSVEKLLPRRGAGGAAGAARDAAASEPASVIQGLLDKKKPAGGGS